jgi:hypothetical protein
MSEPTASIRIATHGRGCSSARMRKRTIRPGGQRIGLRAKDHMPIGHEYEAWMPEAPRTYAGEHRLLRAAVLERAVLDAQWNDREAIYWIHGLTPSEPSFACEEICDILDISVESVRRMVPCPRRSEDARASLGRRLACRPDRG